MDSTGGNFTNGLTFCLREGDTWWFLLGDLLRAWAQFSRGCETEIVLTDSYIVVGFPPTPPTC